MHITHQSFYHTIFLWKPNIYFLRAIYMWSEIIIHLSRMNLILNWKMGSSLHFNSSTFLYILCQRQNLIVDSILRFIQYSLYVQWAIGLVELCPKAIEIKIYIDLPLSYLDRRFDSKTGLFPSFGKSAHFQVPKMAPNKKHFWMPTSPQNGGLHVCFMRVSLLAEF